jgi:hypothetical protein
LENKGEEKEICFNKEVDQERNLLGASSMPTSIKELASEDRESYKKVTRECQTTLAVACKNH